MDRASQSIFTDTIGINSNALTAVFAVSSCRLVRLNGGRNLRFVNFEPSLASYSHLRPDAPSAEEGIDHRCGVVKHGELITLPDFHERVESGRRLPFQHGLLCPTAPRLLVAERYGVNSSEKVR